MSAISTLSDNDVTPHVADVFATAKAAMGKAPTLYRVLAHAPAALDVYTRSKGFLRDGVLSAVAQEQIAIAAANGCDYCLAAHTGRARAAGVSAEDRANGQRDKRPIRRSRPFSSSLSQSMRPTGRERLQRLRQPEPMA